MTEASHPATPSEALLYAPAHIRPYISQPVLEYAAQFTGGQDQLIPLLQSPDLRNSGRNKELLATRGERILSMFIQGCIEQSAQRECLYPSRKTELNAIAFSSRNAHADAFLKAIQAKKRDAARGHVLQMARGLVGINATIWTPRYANDQTAAGTLNRIRDYYIGGILKPLSQGDEEPA